MASVLYCPRRETLAPDRSYLSIPDWKAVDKAERHMLSLTDHYDCADGTYFRPHRSVSDLSIRRERRHGPPAQAGFSTNPNLDKWPEWTKPSPLYVEPGELVKNWIDFWVICDETKAHLFFTSDDGRMWRSDAEARRLSTRLEQTGASCFRATSSRPATPTGCAELEQYLTIVEAIGPGGRRYYKSYLAKSLDGTWEPAAATWETPFAGSKNVADSGPHWADSISHGELFRMGSDERMEVDAGHLRLLFQGVSDERMKGKPYGQIPWQLGILDLAEPR